eukprot:TRINITY_DN1585_c0_g2_i9.p1 TRINITY_DN1585_c0_g2~~TRINITY_DN1585_c0_g2_i9.p1  ORF type:complete len:179 (-),score=53.65 TRINITY_DN1585_c0_g2_i9:241-777(-)
MSWLESNYVASINRSISLWASQCSLADEDSFLDYVSFSFSLICTPFKCYLMVQMEENNSKFIGWLEKFMRQTRINLPYANGFFNLILSSFLGEKQAKKFLCGIDVKGCVSQVKDSFYDMMIKNNVFEGEDEVISFIDSYQDCATKSLSALPGLDSAEETSFKPLARNESEEIEIRLLE